MFGRKEKPKRKRPAGSLEQYGIFEVPESIDDMTGFPDDDDEDLEAELAALTAGDPEKPKRKASRRPVASKDLDAMVAESMKDVNLDDDDEDDGEDDPDLLNELQMITGETSESPTKSSPEEEEPANDDSVDNSQIIKMLEERMAMYQQAESRAKQRNESGKARRYNRGIKTLHELLNNAQAGKSISEGDIPVVLPPSALADAPEQPVAAVEESAPEPENDPAPVAPEETSSEPATATATTIGNQEVLDLLKSRQQEYKAAALSAKKSGNMKDAIQFMNIYKQFDNAIAAAMEGAVIEPSEIPPPPSELALIIAPSTPAPAPREESEVQQSGPSETPSVGESLTVETKDLGLALRERLEVYRRTKTAAETEGNSSKARRYGRICKQFEDAIKLHTRGKPVPFDDLPIPPGFPPLTISATAGAAPAAPQGISQPTPRAPSGPESPQGNTVPSRPKPPTPPARSQTGKKPAPRITSRAEKQMQILQQRLHEFKQAALAAKKDGDLELAREYLRQAKGIEPLIEASRGGLPVDMNSIPLSPLAKEELSAHNISVPDDDSFTLVSREDCSEEVEGTDEQIYENLETQLTKQIKWCLSTRNHCKALGDVPGYNRWERLALGYTRDLDMLRVRKRDMLPSPQHHYETKTYAIVQSCTDLNDSDIELSIIRGVNYAKEADTYVMFEFPYPTDSPPADRTSTIRGTSNPEYEAVFPLTGIIDRSSRQCQRVFKRHGVKCQVWAKGCSLNPLLCCTDPRGLFRSDTLLGTVTVKLQPLETQCVLHDSFPLMEGRKASGGKLEVKLRLRNPMLTKQIEQITDKWLTLDQ